MLGLSAACAANPDASPSSAVEDDAAVIRDTSRAAPATDASEVKALYADWKLAHLAQGGDANIALRLGRSVMSSIDTDAEGLAHLDLVNGTITLQTDGLPESGDVWLVDNQGDGHSLPDAGDKMLLLGTLDVLEEDAEQHAAELSFDVGVLDALQVDLVVISEPGRTPVEGGILFGAVPLFHRVYTDERMREERGRLPRALINTDVYVPATNDFDALVAEGLFLFRDETFDGNGRTCNTCHRIENNFTIDKAFIATLKKSDPLFVHERNPALAELESPKMLRELGLVRANVDGADKPARLRAVPHIKSLAASINVKAGNCARAPSPTPGCGLPPNIGPIDLRNKPIRIGPFSRAKFREGLVLLDSTGWGGDGAPHDGSLLNFAEGAVVQHATKSMARVPGVDFRLPTQEEADALLLFQLAIGRRKDIDTSKITFLDPQAKLGFDLYTNFPGGCKDENGVAHCACNNDLHGNPCGIDKPLIADGAGCVGCHVNAGANTDLNPVPNVRTFVNLNFDIGTQDRVHTKADQITARYGEKRPLDCGLGKLSASDFKSFCTFPISWSPHTTNAPCETGPVEPKKDAFCANPQTSPASCTGYCGVPGAPACNGWFQNGDFNEGNKPLPGKNPFEVQFAPFGSLNWYFAEGSLCDTAGQAVSIPVITAGMPSELACEQLFDNAEWSATSGQAFCVSHADCNAFDVPASGIDSTCVAGRCTHVPGCKCTDDSSCKDGGRQFCFRQAGSPADGYCLGTEAAKTPYDENNPEHVARVGNRVMVEPAPVWSDYARAPVGKLPPGIPGAAGDACNPFLNGTPAAASQCFGAQTCVRNNPYNPASGVCGPNPNWQPQVLSLCEVGMQNPQLLASGGFGCYEGSPNPACQGCKASCEGEPAGCKPCALPTQGAPFERNCPAELNPSDPALQGFGDGTFSTPPLIEAPDTAPFFHDHSAETLEDAIRHYTSPEFNQARGGKQPNFQSDMPANDLDDTEVAAIAAYMRVLNVVQNVNEAGLAIEQTWNNPTSSIGDGRLAFAETELEDAAQVLREGALHKPARARIERARKHLKKAFQTKSNDPKARKAMALALYEIQAARGSMVLIHGSPDDEWTERYLNPSWSDVIEGTLGGAEQSAEEAAFEALLEELGSGD
jgi:hypothetical protein